MNIYRSKIGLCPNRPRHEPLPLHALQEGLRCGVIEGVSGDQDALRCLNDQFLNGRARRPATAVQAGKIARAEEEAHEVVHRRSLKTIP